MRESKPDLWANGHSCLRCLVRFRKPGDPVGYYDGYDLRGRSNPCEVCGHTIPSGPLYQDEWDALRVLASEQERTP